MLLTIGHSTRPLDTFLSLLEEVEVDLLLDVRRFPGSRRHPQFDGARLARSLAERGVDYAHEEALGGRRDPRSGSRNTGLRNASFRAYADHMTSPEFTGALERVLAHAAERRPAVMCAEALPWRCHRWLLSDAVAARGESVLHVLGPGELRAHALNPAARVLRDGSLAYPARPREPSLFEEEG